MIGQILILYSMNLSEVKIKTKCIVKDIKIEDENEKIRLMELGLIYGAKIFVQHKSIFKKTLLVVFNSCCFTLKENVAKNVVVEYA